MTSRLENIVVNEPVGGDDLVEPRESGFVRVAVVTGAAKNRPDLRRCLNLGGDGRIRYRGSGQLEGSKEDDEKPNDPEKSAVSGAGLLFVQCVPSGIRDL